MACEKITTHSAPLPLNIRVESQAVTRHNDNPSDDAPIPQIPRYFVTARASHVPQRARVMFDSDTEEWSL